MTHSTTLTFSALMAASMLATSCGPKETAPDNTIDLTPAFESGDTVNFYDLLDTAYVVKLETSDECLIGASPLYQIIDKNICVSERFPSSNTLVKLFDKNGNFVTSIKQGNGPGEIVGVLSGIVDDKKRNRLIVADLSYQLKYYDYDLNYIACGAQPIEPVFSGFFVCGDRYVFMVPDYLGNPAWGEFSDCKMIVTDTNMNILEGYMHYILPLPHTIFNNSGTFAQNGGKAYYQKTQWDTLYVYDTALHALPVNFPDKAKIDIPINYVDKNELQRINGNYVYKVKPFDNYILFTIKPAGDVLYCKSTKMSVMVNSVPATFSRYGNCFVEPFSYEDLYPEYGYVNKMSELKRILSESDYAKLESLTEDDNPALVIYQLKKTIE